MNNLSDLIKMYEERDTLKRNINEQDEKRWISLLEKMFENDCYILANILECSDNFVSVKVMKKDTEDERVHIYFKPAFGHIVKEIINTWFDDGISLNSNFDPIVLKVLDPPEEKHASVPSGLCLYTLVIPQQIDPYDIVMENLIKFLQSSPKTSKLPIYKKEYCYW